MNILNVAQAEHITQLAVKKLADYIKNSGLKCIVLGISGGLDSAVMAALGLRTVYLLKSNGYDCQYRYVFIDIQSDPGDLLKARELAKSLSFNLSEENLTNWYLQSGFRLTNPSSFAERVKNGNIKCRLRMIYLYAEAGIRQGIVLDTDDLSEYLMGFWTKHGDVGDVKLIQNLTKDEVRDLAEYLSLPQSIVTSPPGDGLGITSTNHAVDQLKVEYLISDYIVSRLVYYNGFPASGLSSQYNTIAFQEKITEVSKEIGEPVTTVENVLRQFLKTAFKRVGEDAVILLPSRKEMQLPELGTYDFEYQYINAIRQIRQ